MEHQQDVKKELLQLGGKAVGIGALTAVGCLWLIGIASTWTGGDTGLAWILILGFGTIALMVISVILLLFGALVVLAGLAYVDNTKRKK